MAALIPTRIRPFPWRSLDATTSAEVSALRDVKRWAAGHVRLDRLEHALRELLDVEMELSFARARPLSLSQAIDDGVGVVLARADTPGVSGSALVEAEGALAANVVARALDRSPPTFVISRGTAVPAIAGAFAAVVVAAARKAHAGFPMRVLDAGPAHTLEADLARREPELWAISLTLLVADDAFAARVIVSRGAVVPYTAPVWNAHVLTALGSTPLAMPIVAWSARATAAEVAALRAGDALMLPEWPLSHRSGAGPAGTVSLAPPSSDLGLRAELGENGRLVLGGNLEPLLAAEAHMDSDEKDAVVAALGEVPVVVRVEIGEAVMAARDWASIGRGDVVSLGRRVGELVLLRVGGIPLARGELVELDGQVAVRIVERFVGEATTT